MYCCRRYVRQYDEFRKYRTMECCFYPEKRTNNQDGKLGKMLSLRTSNLHNLLQFRHMCGTKMTYLWPSIDWFGHSNLGQQEERN